MRETRFFLEKCIGTKQCLFAELVGLKKDKEAVYGSFAPKFSGLFCKFHEKT